MAATLDETSPAALGHVALTIAEAPPPTFFTDTQWRALFAIIDTIVPSVVSGPAAAGNDNDEHHLAPGEYDAYFKLTSERMVKPPSREAFDAYMAERPSDIPAFRDHVTRTIATLLPVQRTQLGTVLWLLR